MSVGAVLTKRASASRSTGVGSAVGSTSALSPVFLASPLKPGGRKERGMLGTCGVMLCWGLTGNGGLVMHQGVMLHHRPTLCPQRHLGPALGHGLMLCQIWMQLWGVVLVQCHRPVQTNTSPWISPAPQASAAPRTNASLHTNIPPKPGWQTSASATYSGTMTPSPQHTLHWGSPGN